MKSKWQSLSTSDQIAALENVAHRHRISSLAVEKDWWVTSILQALSQTRVGKALLFKGGTSLSKGWNLIERFSEDIDLSIDRTFFLEELGCPFARCENNNQIKSLRKASRDFIHDELSKELNTRLTDMGITGFKLENVIMRETEQGLAAIDHDSDPTVIFVHYDTILQSAEQIDIDHKVKIEISCLSMSEPFEVKHITSLIGDILPEADETYCNIRTVTPTRTFIEKVLLLNEELQKNRPRSRRMSRHLYDIDRLYHSEYGLQAINDLDLFKAIVEHRRKFYHLGYVDYNLDYPENIHFCPEGEMLELFKNDYNRNMVSNFIYGEALPFETLMETLRKLQSVIRNMGGK